MKSFRSVWIAFLSAALLTTGCADMTVLRTKEIRKVEENLRGRLDSLQAEIDSLKMEYEKISRRNFAELAAIQRAVREGTEVVSARVEESSYLLEQLRIAPPAVGSSDKQSPPAADKKGKRPSQNSQPVVVDSAAIVDAELARIYSTARTDFNAQNYVEAFKGFKEVYERAPQGIRAEDAMYWMALCYERTGQSDPAVTVYQQLLTVFPQGKKSCSARFQLARIAEEKGEGAERLRLLQELVAEPACASSNEGRRAAELLRSP